MRSVLMLTVQMESHLVNTAYSLERIVLKYSQVKSLLIVCYVELFVEICVQ